MDVWDLLDIDLVLPEVMGDLSLGYAGGVEVSVEPGYGFVSIQFGPVAVPGRCAVAMICLVLMSYLRANRMI